MSSALTIRQLTKTYGNGFQALHGIDLDVAEGDFFALLGPNGAGKSTTIKMLTGILFPSDGQATVFGYTPWQDRRQLGYHIGSVFG
ncbi:ATP-binding cassette domain-containing protein, partial [Ectopseudomonas oleovorans]|uniref:ATP-binding cassette domain-containing protein n=1 Tax=Ectopseudomonas oleovorans TaxID=301 RepID=UPI00241CAE76